MSHPDVCLIVTTFNVAHLWNQTIAGVQAQTYPGSIHIVVVDDDSTDGTDRMVASSAKETRQLHALMLPLRSPGGVATALSIGLEYCKRFGPVYIANVDGDDVVEPWAIEEMVALAEYTRVQMVVAGYTIVSSDLTITAKPSHSERRAMALAPLQRTRHNLTSHLGWYTRTLPAPWRKLVRASLMYQVEKLCLLDGDHLYEDNFLHWCLGSATDTFAWLERATIRHRASRTVHATPQIVRGGFLHNFELIVRAPWLTTRWKTHLPAYIRSYQWIVHQQTNKKWQKKTQRLLNGLEQRSRATVGISRTRVWKYDLSIVVPCYLSGFRDIRLLATIATVLRSSPTGSIEAMIVASRQEVSSSYDKCECSGLRLSDEFHDVYTALVRGTTAGMMRNYAIPFVEGKYVLFADVDDAIVPLALHKMLRIAMHHIVDVLVFPYTTCNARTNRCTGMLETDSRLYAKALKSSRHGAARFLALRLINYPWNRLVRTEHMHAHSAFFGTTAVHNDVNYHWSTTSNARSVAFVNNTTPVVEHWMHSDAQITHLTSALRIQNYVALEYTHRYLLRHVGGFCDSRAAPIWNQNIRNILGWGESRIPDRFRNLYMRKTHALIVCAQRCTGGCLDVQVF